MESENGLIININKITEDLDNLFANSNSSCVSIDAVKLADALKYLISMSTAKLRQLQMKSIYKVNILKGFKER